MRTLLSVLIPTVPGREAALHKLLRSLEEQAARRDDVEVLTLRDARRMSASQKRNALMSIATGRYLVFVDDDDHVAPNYVAAICEGLQRLGQPPDVLCFDAFVRGFESLGHRPMICRYDPFAEDSHTDTHYIRRANHLMVWRADLARAVPFVMSGPGEDYEWADAMHRRHRLLGREVTVARVDEVLYTYRGMVRSDRGMVRSVMTSVTMGSATTSSSSSGPSEVSLPSSETSL